MGWARFDDNYSDHPKLATAGPWAELLDMRAIIYCCKQETDGHVARAVLPKLGVGIPAPRAKAQTLVQVGRWLVDAHDGWRVHDFLKYNPSHAAKEAERAAARDRMSKARSGRSSPEHRQNFAGSSGNPVPSRPQSEPVNGFTTVSWLAEEEVIQLASRFWSESA